MDNFRRIVAYRGNATYCTVQCTRIIKKKGSYRLLQPLAERTQCREGRRMLRRRNTELARRYLGYL